MAKAGSIDIYLNAYTSAFEKGLAKAQKSLANFSAGFADVNGAVEIAQKAWAGFSAVAERFASQLERLDSLADMSQRLGVSADSLQVFQRAIQLSGGEVEGLDKSLVTLRRNLGDAAMGQGGAVKALERLGLNAKELAKVGLDDAFKSVISELSKIENPTIRAAEASDVFGKSAANLAGLMDSQGASLRQATKEMKAYGTEVDKNAKAIDAAVQAKERTELAQQKAEAAATVATASYWASYYEGKAMLYNGVAETDWSIGNWASHYGVVPYMIADTIAQQERKYQASRFDPERLVPPTPGMINGDIDWNILERGINRIERGARDVMPDVMQSPMLDAYMQRSTFRPRHGAEGPAVMSAVDRWRILESLGVQASDRGSSVSGGVGALEFGSAAAYSAIQQSHREDEMRKLQRQEVDESKKQTKALEEMRGFFKNTVQLVEAGLQG